MINKRLGGLAASTAVALGAGLCLPQDLIKACLRSSAFYLLFVLFLIWVYLLVRVYGSNPAVRLRRHLPALLLAVVLTSLIFLISPPRFKILADETNLIGVSMMMHETRTAAIPLEGVYTDYAAPKVTTADVKRPMLFSFLTALLHAMLGYNAGNGFVLNFLASVLALWLFSIAVTRWLPIRYGLFGALLMAAAPVYVMCATSSGFELLNLLFMVIVFLVWADLEKDGFTPLKAEILLFALVLLSHCRYESVAAALFVVPALAVALGKKRFSAAISWRVMLIPLFFLPIAWQRMIYWGKPEFNRESLLGGYTLVESAFGWQNIVKNLDDNLFVLLGLNPNYGYTPLISALALAGLYLWIRTAWNGKPAGLSARIVAAALGVFALLLLVISAFYWGNFGIPMDIRLSLVFLPFMCWGAVYAAFRIRGYFPASSRRRPIAGLLLLAGFHLALFWPAGALQRPLRQLSRPYEYEAVRKLVRQHYPEPGYTLLVADLPNLYLVQGYSALKINNHQGLRSIIGQPNIFDRILAVQKYDQANGAVLASYRLPEADFHLREVDSFALTAEIGIRISELQPTQN